MTTTHGPTNIKFSITYSALKGGIWNLVYSIPEYTDYGVYALHRYYPHPRAVPGCITRSSCHSIHNVLNNVPLLANKSASFSVTHPSLPCPSQHSCTVCPTLYGGTLGLNLNVGRYYDYFQAYLIISFWLFCLKISLRTYGWSSPLCLYKLYLA